MIILEFTQDRLKLLEVARKRQRLTLARLSKKNIAASLQEAGLSSAVLDLLSEAGVGKKRPLIICVPRHLFTVRTLRLPALDDTELKGMAGLQAGKQLPYPANELIWDFRIIEKRPDGYTDISLVLGHRNVIDRFLNILNSANLKVDRIILSTEALWAWYLAVMSPKGDLEVSPVRHCGANASANGVSNGVKGQIRAVVDIDTSYVDIIILRGNILEFSRSFAFKDDLQETADEIRKTFYSYQKENSREVASLVLTGIEEKALGLRPLVEGTIEGLKGIEFIHPLKVVSVDYRGTVSDYFDLSRDISFSCLLGIAYNTSSISMDFLPPELKLKRHREKRKRVFVRTILLLASIALLIFGFFIKDLTDKRGQLNLVNLKIKETEPRVKRLREQSQQIEIIKQSLEVKGSSVDVLREIFKVVPPGVSISVLDFELDRSLALRGASTDLSSVFRFASALEKSNYFENCQIKYAQKRVVKEKEFVDFEINSKLSRVLK